jgi:60S ribosomal subunit assembly/export protein LOC1
MRQSLATTAPPNIDNPLLPMAPKPPARLSRSSTIPKKPSKKKFTPKTHTTAGVALGKTKAKDPKKQRAALLQRVEKELPKLNMITPAGVVKPKGKKKGKIFVEDREHMMGILNRVNDDKDGRIKSKLERSVC